LAKNSEWRLLAPCPLEWYLTRTSSQESREPTFTAWGGNLGVKFFRRTSRPTRVRYVWKKLTLAKNSEWRLLAPCPLEWYLTRTSSQESREPTFTAWGVNLGVKCFRRTSRPTRVRYVWKKLTLAKNSEWELLAPCPLEWYLTRTSSQESMEPTFTAWGVNLGVKLFWRNHAISCTHFTSSKISIVEVKCWVQVP